MRPNRVLFLFTVLLHQSMFAQSILVDHHSVALFDHIPQEYADAASQLRMLFMDRSVGGNINDALSCLAVPRDEAPNSCTRYTHRVPEYAVDPSEVSWEGTWDRSNWRYEFWPAGCSEDADCFIDAVEPRIDSLDVVGFQFSYLAVMPGSDLADPARGFFSARQDRGTAASYAAFAARHPGKTVLWWTTSLARAIGTPESEAFNTAMRDYARVNGEVLFDVADILSHDPSGAPCYDNRDGVAYLDENLPDDGLDIPAICPQYTTETNGGHLGSISAGGIRVAKAFWVLMARIAGWDGDTSGTTSAGTLPAGRTAAAGAFDLAAAPNPVREVFTLSFTLAHSDRTIVELFDVLGRRRAMLHDGTHRAGRSALHLARPAGLAHGVYFLRLRAHDGVGGTVLRLR